MLCLVTQDSIIKRHLICEAVVQSDGEPSSLIIFTIENEPAKLTNKRWRKKQNIHTNPESDTLPWVERHRFFFYIYSMVIIFFTSNNYVLEKKFAF